MLNYCIVRSNQTQLRGKGPQVIVFWAKERDLRRPFVKTACAISVSWDRIRERF